jgi:hypothetical protein
MFSPTVSGSGAPGVNGWALPSSSMLSSSGAPPGASAAGTHREKSPRVRQPAVVCSSTPSRVGRAARKRSVSYTTCLLAPRAIPSGDESTNWQGAS